MFSFVFFFVSFFNDFTFKEELLGMISFKETTRGVNTFKAFKNFINDFKIPLFKLVSVTTDGTAVMRNHKNGFSGWYQF